MSVLKPLNKPRRKFPDSIQEDFQEYKNEDEQKISLPAIIIPGEILFNPFISSTEKILFGFIRSLSKSSRGCWASNLFLSQLIGRNRTSTSLLLSNLRDYGYIKIIEIKKRDGTFERRIYERTEYHELYKPIIEVAHDYLYSYYDFSKKGLWKIIKGIMENHKYNKNIKDKNIINKEYKNIPLKGSEEPFFKKDNKSSQKKILPDFIKPQTGEYAVLCSWNKLPGPAYAHTKLNTKTVKHIAEFIGQMRNGVFGDPSRRKWDGRWLDKHKINLQVFAEKKWTIREICRTIEGPLADMYKDGYWPQSKDRLPKSVADAFYNSRTQTSFFIQAYYDSPGQLKNKVGHDPYPDITEALVKEGILDLKQVKSDDWKRYLDGVKGIAKCLEDIDWSNYGARQMFRGGRSGDPYTLIMGYVKWMKGETSDIRPSRSALEQIHVGMIKPDFWAWQEFMISVNRYWKGVFRSIPYEEG